MRNSDNDKWQISEIEAGIAELDSGHGISHDDVARWLRSWAQLDEAEPPVTPLQDS